MVVVNEECRFDCWSKIEKQFKRLQLEVKFVWVLVEIKCNDVVDVRCNSRLSLQMWRRRSLLLSTFKQYHHVMMLTGCSLATLPLNQASCDSN